MPRRILRSVSLTWNDTPPPVTRIVDGAWWDANQPRPEVAVSQPMADRLSLHVGSVITFTDQDKQIPATVAAIVRSNGQHTYSRAEYTLDRSALAGLPVVWYGGIHVVPNQVAQLERVLNAAYPTVTIINVAEVVESIRSVVIQIIYVVQFLSAFSIFAGVIILASSIAGTKYRRIREVVVLKTLGATRARIAAIFSIEFAVLGLVAGLVGLFFANFLAWALERFTPMNLTFKANVPVNLDRSARRRRAHRPHRLDRLPPHPRPEAPGSFARGIAVWTRIFHPFRGCPVQASLGRQTLHSKCLVSLPANVAPCYHRSCEIHIHPAREVHECRTICTICSVLALAAELSARILAPAAPAAPATHRPARPSLPPPRPTPRPRASPASPSDNAREFGSDPGRSPARSPAISRPPSRPAAIEKAVRKVADWQLAQTGPYFGVVDRNRTASSTAASGPGPRSTDGYMAAADEFHATKYSDAMRAMGKAYNWQLHHCRPPALPNADQHVRRAVLGGALLHRRQGPQPRIAADTKVALDAILAAPRIPLTPETSTATVGHRIEWWWCDALFMSPARLGAHVPHHTAT